MIPSKKKSHGRQETASSPRWFTEQTAQESEPRTRVPSAKLGSPTPPAGGRLKSSIVQTCKFRHRVWRG